MGQIASGWELATDQIFFVVVGRVRTKTKRENNVLHVKQKCNNTHEVCKCSAFQCILFDTEECTFLQLFFFFLLCFLDLFLCIRNEPKSLLMKPFIFFSMTMAHLPQKNICMMQPVAIFFPHSLPHFVLPKNKCHHKPKIYPQYALGFFFVPLFVQWIK